jgi:hypothetical protein
MIDMKDTMLWIILILLIVMDFITTYYAIGIKNYYEYNPILRSLYQNQDYISIFVYTLIITPIFFYGLYNLFKRFSKKYYQLFYLLIIIYITVVLNNLGQLIN